MRIFDSPFSSAPEVQLLSNGRYHVAVTNAGGGYSRWNDLAVTRWREDTTRDCWGSFIYLRDPASSEFWSVGYQPTLRMTDEYKATFTPAQAEFYQRHAGFEIVTRIWVSPEDDVEIRRVVISNLSGKARALELTSYAEVVLAVPAADLAHPVFSNLFIQTELVRAASAILCNRRPRGEGAEHPWMVHLMVGDDGGELSCETDRARFLGRGRTAANPAAMHDGSPLSNTVGSVLDPVASLRRTFQLAAESSITVDFVTGLAPDRHAALSLAEKYRAPQPIAVSQELAESQLAPPELEDADVDVYGQLASALIYPSSTFRTPPEVLAQNKLGPNALWRHGISGDLPIALLRILGTSEGTINFDPVKQLIQAHTYWHKQGLAADLIILVEQTSDTSQALIDQIESFIASRLQTQPLEKSGGILIRHLGQLTPEEHVLFQAVARVVFTDQGGTLKEQLAGRDELPTSKDELLLVRAREEASKSESKSDSDERELIPTEESIPTGTLLFNNGAGGFTADGREYVITLEPGVTTPVPWVNVLANPNFGTVVSETGGAYTWAENSHELRLTPWNNDPVTDLSGEAFYLRDDETAKVWSPTPLPARGKNRHVVRHGFGYSVFKHSEQGISSELTIYVAIDATVKFAALKLRNTSERSRRISATGYWEWVFSDLRQRTALHIQTEIDGDTGAFLARNFYNNAFTDWIAFIDVDGADRTFTGDRNEFLGRNGNLTQPAALSRDRLSGKVGAGLDPCGAVQTTIDLAPGAEQEICFRMGAGKSLTEVQQLVRQFREANANQNALAAVQQYWTHTLGTVRFETPDPSIDVMANGWLLYQVLVCRVWGRTGFYQSGGAFGFRDQLQDVMALVHAEPRLTREHLLRAAARQFREGDVQHWWHPPTGQGVRTHTSDDYLWLPYVTWQYVTRTGDTSVLDEKVPFIEGQLLKPEEADVYFQPKRSDESGSLYEHCVRSIEHGLRFGQHGLPLMGTCDWNDGMNLVGKGGRGESVWLGFFLYDVLQRFGKLARERHDIAFADRCLAQAKEIQANIEKHAWDGNWYRRAYFDSGEPLGSHVNEECQIDCLPQSWSVISGAGNPERARQAMQSLNERLVRRDAKLIQLLDPPFDRSKPSPGYIQGYVPGVRENGGQYTHAAIWTVLAAALEGNGELAWELFALLNPVNHGRTAADIATYKVEPYVIAADVYWVPPHTGRGGWTWYTGSAGWMYRTLIETLLGLRPEGDQLRLSPCLPKAWPGYKIHYRYGDTLYHISIARSSDAQAGSKTYLDGKEISTETVPLVDDKREHQIEVRV
ncbi:MAG TPA: glycosyl hydrolase family 65 protein [Chthoniobacterales bacterium]